MYLIRPIPSVTKIKANSIFALIQGADSCQKASRVLPADANKESNKSFSYTKPWDYS